ncbi:hypothetical protein [Paraflavitalea speifideaquila]|uniref:hypothetical protein n=1 Tax=Paraflavitalea speifideaquila TaxID=3076558 RepID=UPI0028EC7AA2|nr:hypothetical protein [Paraflavitalea speifideiaquila]
MLLIIAGCSSMANGRVKVLMISPFFNPPYGDTSVVWETVLDSTSFSDYTRFEQHWNYLYPWGKDHNGSARMYASPTNHRQVALKNKTLRIRASYITHDEGKSRHEPYQAIKYHSGAIHARHQVTVSNEYPRYEVSGYFKAPVARGPGQHSGSLP